MARLIDALSFCLLVAGIVVSIIELGLTADIVNWLRDRWDGGWKGGPGFADDNDPFTSRTDFLLFCSVWSIVVTGFLIAVPFVRSVHSHRLLAHITLGLTFVTMIFWLAGFAAFADLFNGPTGEIGATLAFAVIAWLIYLGLFAANCLTAFSFHESDRPGFTPFARVSRVEKGHHTTTV